MASQLGQDHFVLQLLHEQHHGYFIDAGAADGVRSSNTLLLEREYGWHGVCIEPNDRYFAALRSKRQCVCVHACLYDRDMEVDFLEGANMLGGIVQAYPPAMLRYTHAMCGPDPARVRKRTTTIGHILREVGAPPVIDYWSLDTEGSELSILQAFPFDHYRLRVLTVEHNRQPVREALRQFLETRGFRHVHDFGIDDCYVGPGEVVAADSGHRHWRSAALKLRRRQGEMRYRRHRRAQAAWHRRGNDQSRAGDWY